MCRLLDIFPKPFGHHTDTISCSVCGVTLSQEDAWYFDGKKWTCMKCRK